MGEAARCIHGQRPWERCDYCLEMAQEDSWHLRACLAKAVQLLDEIVNAASSDVTRSVSDKYLAAYVEPELPSLRRALGGRRR